MECVSHQAQNPRETKNPKYHIYDYYDHRYGYYNYYGEWIYYTWYVQKIWNPKILKFKISRSQILKSQFEA